MSKFPTATADPDLVAAAMGAAAPIGGRHAGSGEEPFTPREARKTMTSAASLGSDPPASGLH